MLYSLPKSKKVVDTLALVKAAATTANIRLLLTTLTEATDTYTGWEIFCRVLAENNILDIFKCQHCGLPTPNQEGTLPYRETNMETKGICPTCKDQRYMHYTGEDHPHQWVRRDDERFRALVPQLIYSYSTNPLQRLKFRVAKDEGVEKVVKEGSKTPSAEVLYMGVELELHVPHSGQLNKMAEFTQEFLGKEHVILKQDSSIPNGFEVVSCPATLSYHKDVIRWKDFFDTTYVKDGRFKAADPSSNCGMHVHLSRTPFEKVDLNNAVGRMMFLLSARENRQFMSLIGNRDIVANQFTRASDERTHDGLLGNNQKYSPLYMTGKNTLEFRLFRSTIKGRHFFKNIEFVHAVGMWGLTTKDVDLLSFTQYVFKNEKLYPSLVAFIREMEPFS